MTTILILAANPRGTETLRLGAEFKKIKSAIQNTTFKLEQSAATCPADLQPVLLEYRPRVVHFCGHGNGADGIVFEDEKGFTQQVSTEALAELFRLCTEDVECVVLNACYSMVQAQAIAAHIPFVVGMQKEIGDQAALKFVEGFYQALAHGKDYPIAYEFGCNAIHLDGISGHLTPVLLPVVGDIAAETAPSMLSSVKSDLEAVGGVMPLNSSFYIVRSSDEMFYTALTRGDSIVLIKGARQVGKTSLLARGCHNARQNGVQVVFTDFQKLVTTQLRDLETFFLALGDMLVEQLDLDVSPQDNWKAGRSATINFERFVKRQVLNQFEQPLLWAMDEVDRLFSCDFSNEVFGLFRSWHNARAFESSWQQLTLAIAYATETHLFIRDPNQSPFNVGTRLTLNDFTLEQVVELNQRYGTPLGSHQAVDDFYRLLGGQPYLVRCGFNELVSCGGDLAQFTTHATQDSGPFGDHLRRLLVMLSRDELLCDVVRGLLHEQPCNDAEHFYRLRSAGVVAGEVKEEARLRCELYRLYLHTRL